MRLETTLEALYNLNKHARIYGQRAEEHYRNGKGATAKTNSIKKKALYAAKSEALRRLLSRGVVDRVEQHEIHGRSYYCFYLGEWSFHSPVDTWTGANMEGRIVGEPRRLEKFEKNGEKNRSSMTLKNSLLTLKYELGIDVNAYLPEERVWYGSNSYYAGWSFLND